MQGSIKKRSNLRDVAALSGVSVATVSRVLNTPQKVAPTTRERVEAAIAELKFVPSAAARAMNRGNSGMVAALLPTLDNAIYARVVNGLEARLTSDGLSLMVAQTKDDPAVELQRAKQLIEIGAEALIVVGLSHDPGLFELIERAQRPIVAISYYDENSAIPTIGYDNWAAATIAAQHLCELGHKHIAVLHGATAHNDRMRQRKSALESQDLGLHFTFIDVGLSVEGGQAGVNQILEHHRSVTAMLCFSDVIAQGALHRLNALGIAVPGDLSVMGIENLPSSQFTYPQLTSVRLSVERMGELSAEAIISSLKTQTPPSSINLPIELVQRASTAGVSPRQTVFGKA
ncbi:MAG: LacI family DNA-binding transcriptional regulator [Pseudomonadota bacterium]